MKDSSLYQIGKFQKKHDPVSIQPETGNCPSGLSPMDPPDAYSPPAVDKVKLEEMHPFLRQFVEEHALFLEEIKKFEETILSIQKDGYTREADKSLRHFFTFFDLEFMPHNKREDVSLFPLLNQRLLISGEHSKTEIPTTSVDLMEEDHLKASQLAAVILNFFELAFRLPDQGSKLIVLDMALEQGKDLVELLRLHIFREDNMVLPTAHRLISWGEFDDLEQKAKRPGISEGVNLSQH